MMHFKGFFMFPYVGKIDPCVLNLRKTTLHFHFHAKTLARGHHSESKLIPKRSQMFMTTTNMVTRYINSVSVRKEVKSEAVLQTAVRPLNPSRHEDGEFLSAVSPVREKLTTNTTSTISVCLIEISATRSKWL